MAIRLRPASPIACLAAWRTSCPARLPFRASLPLKDIAEFYAYGGKANGCGLCTTNLLSSITAANGTNTTGYTLAQWQAFYLVYNATKGAQPGHSPHQRGGRGRASVRHQQDDAGRDPLAAERPSLPD
ncbi:protein of unknown function [Methylorubrum extorquens]|uniref:Uncharacterized protein n=1 Tax=Methylorubrum extorquens TaxID=408 RepID=A0A2N9AVM9_METEX|nr:protein of unknown function [Methylorubrum extorquens]